MRRWAEQREGEVLRRLVVGLQHRSVDGDSPKCLGCCKQGCRMGWSRDKKTKDERCGQRQAASTCVCDNDKTRKATPTTSRRSMRQERAKARSRLASRSLRFLKVHGSPVSRIADRSVRVLLSWRQRPATWVHAPPAIPSPALEVPTYLTYIHLPTLRGTLWR